MNIYQWAEDYDYNADYLDYQRGLIYKCQEYGKVKDDPEARIRVVSMDNNETIGYAQK